MISTSRSPLGTAAKAGHAKVAALPARKVRRLNGFIVNAASTREATLHDREPAYQPANGD
jgi:hypothetical protein